MKTVFFYGLFMDEDLLKSKGLNPSSAKNARVVGYGLRIGKRATLVASPEEQTYGTIIQLAEEELDILYGEESVEDYRPEAVTAIDTNGNTLTAVCYILPPEKLSGQNKAYAKSLVKVTKKLGLPEKYIGEVERWVQ